MSFVLLHADRVATALVDDPVVPAAEVGTLRSALALLEAAGQIRGEAEARATEAIEAGYQRGHAQGLADGRAAGEAEMRTEMFRLAMRDGEARKLRQDEIAGLALEVVRRIAGAIGDEAMVARLAERAAAQLAPDTAATVRVPPAALAEASQRLSGLPHLIVEEDATLAPTDCVVETALGRTHAGLETQLSQIERSWAEAARERA
jgi:type III secretion protein L